MKHDELAASLSQQPTLPLDRLASQTTIAFNTYIDQYHLDPLAIALVSGGAIAPFGTFNTESLSPDTTRHKYGKVLSN